MAARQVLSPDFQVISLPPPSLYLVAGDEITISYFRAHVSYHTRQYAQWTDFRFTCTCEVCLLPHDQRRESDKRRDEIHRLDKSIGGGQGVRGFHLQGLHDVHRLRRLLNEEGISDASVPKAYYDAFQVSIAHGDVARARVIAERAAFTRAIMEGHDSPEDELMESLAKNPSLHMAYGLSSKWETAMGDVPKDLDAEIRTMALEKGKGGSVAAYRLTDRGSLSHV